MITAAAAPGRRQPQAPPPALLRVVGWGELEVGGVGCARGAVICVT